MTMELEEEFEGERKEDAEMKESDAATVVDDNEDAGSPSFGHEPASETEPKEEWETGWEETPKEEPNEKLEDELEEPFKTPSEEEKKPKKKPEETRKDDKPDGETEDDEGIIEKVEETLEKETRIVDIPLLVIIVACIIGAGLIGWFGITHFMLAPPASNVTVTTDQVTIIQYSEFLCPYCSMVEATVQELKDYYGDDITIEWRHFTVHGDPLTHSGSALSAEAAECARDQGMFDEMKGALFEAYFQLSQDITNATVLKSIAAELGLDATEFSMCLDGGTKAAIVVGHVSQARADGVTGTPSFIIGGEKLVGAQPFSTFQELIDGALSGELEVGEPEILAVHYFSDPNNPTTILSELVGHLSNLENIEVTTTEGRTAAQGIAGELGVTAWPTIVFDMDAIQEREDLMTLMQSFLQANSEYVVTRATEDEAYLLVFEFAHIEMFVPQELNAVFYDGDCSVCGNDLSSLVSELDELPNVVVTFKNALDSRSELEALSLSAYPAFLIDYVQSTRRIDVFSKLVDGISRNPGTIEGTVTAEGLGVISTATKMEFIPVNTTLNESGVHVNLYIMSQCPYGILAEQNLGVVYDALNGTFDVSPVFIVNYDASSGSISSLHGEPEVLENKRQKCIYNELGVKAWLEYALCYDDKYYSGTASDTAFAECVDELAIDSVTVVDACIDSGVATKLLVEDAIETGSKGISSSPTIMIVGQDAGESVQVSRSLRGLMDSETLKSEICAMYSVAGIEAVSACSDSNSTLESAAVSGSGPSC